MEFKSLQKMNSCKCIFRDEINKILKEHNGDTLAFTWLGSSSKSDSDMGLVVHIGLDICNYTYMDYRYISRAVVN